VGREHIHTGRLEDDNLAQINTPAPIPNKIKSLQDFLKTIGDWQHKHASSGGDEGFLSQLWYRGVNEHFPTQVPSVYRQDFTDRAEKLRPAKPVEENRLKLEREILSQFRTAGAAFLNRNSTVEIYFAAAHVRMPTRLLDWSTNPLNALLFACGGDPRKDGFVYAMDARKVIPPGAMWKERGKEKERLYQAVMTMRHPFVGYAVGLSYWGDVDAFVHPHVLPIRPDNVPGRIAQQSSCFTLHMHNAPDAKNPTLITIPVDAGSKDSIRADLHRLNINQFTTYYDLDHLSIEIRSSWGLRS
jgi:hypothetical protein